MNDSRGSTGDGIWIGLCVLLVLLLALAGGFVWIQRQFAARAMAAAEMARAAEQENRLQAQLALAAAEQARSDAARSEVEETQAQLPSADDASPPPQPVVPDLYLNQDLWRHVETVANAEPDAKVFTLDPQTGDIRFGDGEHGARPPDGAATIQAEFRTNRGGTVTVYLPDTDLQQCRLRAVRLTDGTLRLEVTDSKRDE